MCFSLPCSTPQWAGGIHRGQNNETEQERSICPLAPLTLQQNRSPKASCHLNSLSFLGFRGKNAPCYFSYAFKLVLLLPAWDYRQAWLFHCEVLESPLISQGFWWCLEAGHTNTAWLKIKVQMTGHRHLPREDKYQSQLPEITVMEQNCK